MGLFLTCLVSPSDSRLLVPWAWLLSGVYFCYRRDVCAMISVCLQGSVSRKSKGPVLNKYAGDMRPELDSHASFHLDGQLWVIFRRSVQHLLDRVEFVQLVSVTCMRIYVNLGDFCISILVTFCCSALLTSLTSTSGNGLTGSGNARRFHWWVASSSTR